LHYDINIQRLPHQKALMQSKARTIGLVTGFGGGKSLGGAANILKHSMLNSGIDNMAVSR
jgi:hypothetical protein